MFVYLDNSSTTRQYDEVTRTVTEAAESCFGNPSSLHSFGFASEREVEKARGIIADSLGAAEEEIFFTSGGTESDNTALYGIAGAKRRAGNKIITSKAEHAAVLEACRILEKKGFEVDYIGVDRYCRLNMEELESAVDKNTILISLMAVNNETGTITPIRRAAALKAGAVLHTDAVQGYGKISLRNTGADMISLSSHKIHGPKGIGALYVKKGVNFTPLLAGGGQERHMRPGTENVPAIAGFGKACEIMEGRFDERTRKMAEVKSYLKKGITDRLKDVLVNTPEDSVPSILNISFLGTRGEVLLHFLEQDGIFVSTGAACSSKKRGMSHVLKAMGLKDSEAEGALRFSFSEFNTVKEMDYVLDRLENAVNRFRRLGSPK